MIEKIGPYRVYERLGVGGMGEVYKAYDDRLDRWVAIKRIRPDREDAEDNRERFKREARATARLNHPSIVHLYGIFQDGDSDCIVMEYVDGKTLDQLLAEGPLDPLRVANLGHEIAAGLAEAHANGILHRDLKAENIMITPRGRAKILDFGLAKPILNAELDPVLTGKGQLVGTSRAMSPEYVSGEAVDHRSDLFSLGVLLYECVTGHSPFKAHNTLATLKQVMLHKQTPIKQLNSKVPTELSDLIDRLLEKDPKNRPQNAQEVTLAFGRLTGQVSSGVVDIPGGLPSADLTRNSSTLTSFSASDTVLDLRPRHRWMTLLAVIVVLVAGAFVLGKFFTEPDLDEPDLPPEERIYIVLADFENSSDEENLGASLRRAFRAILDQSRSSSVLSRGQMNDALRRMQEPTDQTITRELARKISKREGAARFIAGSVSKFGSSYSIVIDVVEPDQDGVTFSFADTSKDSQELLRDLEVGALKIRAHLGESVAEIEKSIPLAKVVTPDIDALKAYTLGLERTEGRRSDEAIPFLLAAIELDPAFSMAHAKLGVIYSNRAERDPALKHLNQALANSERLSEVERFYVKAWLARWNGSPDDVVDNWSTLAQLHPGNQAAAFNLGLALWYYRNDFEGALGAFEKSFQVSRGLLRDSDLRLQGQMQLALGKLEAAEKTLESIERAEEKEPLRSLILLSRGRPVPLEEIPVESPGIDQGAFELLRAMGQAANGQYEDALSTLNGIDSSLSVEAEIQFHVFADKIVLLAELGREQDLSRLAAEAVQEGKEWLFPETMNFANSTVSLFAIIGKVHIRQGRLDDARTVQAYLESGEVDSGFVLWELYRKLLDAEILLAEGDSSRSIQLLREADALAPSFQVKESLAFAETIAEKRGSPVMTEDLRGLALMECTFSCYGRMYSYLLSLGAKTPREVGGELRN